MAFTSWHSKDEDGIRIPAIGLDLRVRLPPAASDSALTIIETTNAPGFGPPLHRHPETEVFRVLAGRYLFEVDGARFYAETGDLVCVPGGAAHGFVNVTDAPGQQLVMIMPGLDAEAFFTGLGDIMKDGIPDRAALNLFGGRWNVEFLGPPLRPD
ncbi:cupin domain-containing protein [Rhizobium sp. BK251]|uniref:cupin domain-containing protein n=1 Tax=Rhizobium sp. BK251 TaxID=2512125 RepID=UPI0010479D24|nr:cupin domain-containing protein [Rhizobium sp. BK251]TCL69841.1 quercetin dioxygenase-like cupin family protein [Rhizobium sp. BK251]